MYRPNDLYLLLYVSKERCMRAESCKRLNQSMERNIENCRMQHISLMTHELCLYVSESLITNVMAKLSLGLLSGTSLVWLAPSLLRQVLYALMG